MSQPSGGQSAAVSRCLRWCFTLNNWTPEEEVSLCGFASGGLCRFFIFGREHTAASESGPDAPFTPHLQGYFELLGRCRLSQVKKFPGLARAHLEPAMGSAEENVTYCTKEDAGAFVYGTPAPSRGNSGGAATRELYKRAIEHAEAGNIDAIDPSIRLRCLRSLQCILEQAEWRRSESGLRAPDIILYPWQTALDDLIWGPPSDRAIRCYVDPVGSTGKTTFCEWLHFHYGVGRTCHRTRGELSPPTVQVFHPSRGVDMARLLRPAKVYVVDCPRASLEYVPWSTIEEVKNGFCTSTKYDCQQKRFPRPHVILFLNAPVPEGKFSVDRLEIVNLSVLE